MRLDASARRAVLDFVRPLDQGLDGEQKFGRVDERLARVDALAADRPELDRDRLFLLAVFFDRSRWLGSMGHASRTGIFLEGLGMARVELRDFFGSLKRAESAPETPEEEVVWDAARLEDVGALGLVRGILAGFKERLELAELARAVLESQESTSFRTAAGRRLAEERKELVRRFEAQLRDELAR